MITNEDDHGHTKEEQEDEDEEIIIPNDQQHEPSYCCCRRRRLTLRHWQTTSTHRKLRTLAGVMGNVLEWYDFAVFGFFSDILGKVFFPKDQSEDLSVMESFAVFGGAFLMRPVGGLVIGYIGDTQGRKKALEISIFLMALATTLMGCLPTYQQIGNSAILLLLLVRMIQGLSVGGQLMSSLVFTLEGKPTNRWGLYGSFVMAGANVGTLLGGCIAYFLRWKLTEDQLMTWGWRIPFLSGILISFCGIYLKYVCTEDEDIAGHDFVTSNDDSNNVDSSGAAAATTTKIDEDDDGHIVISNTRESTELDDPLELEIHRLPSNPLRLAFSQENRRSLLASAMVPLVWSGGFYISFVWLAIYMQDLIDPPVPAAFGVNSCSLLLLGIWFPLAGALSDKIGRRRVMTAGGIFFLVCGPILLLLIGYFGSRSAWIAFGAQTGLSLSLAMWGAPMCAWLVESFEPQARLTSVSIGYNVAQALGGGFSPFVATLLVDEVGIGAPGILLMTLATLSLIGLWCVAPSRHKYNLQPQEDSNNGGTVMDLELKEIT